MNDKWCPLYVYGEPVSQEQAAQILIRTDENSFPQRNGPVRPFISTVHSSLFLRVLNWSDELEFREKMDRVTGRIDLYYLSNRQICTAWIQGLSGWCHWNGLISTDFNRPYSVGKYPSQEEILKEWTQIAERFPFLDLRCWLKDQDDDGNPERLTEQFRVVGGKATVEPVDESIFQEYWSKSSKNPWPEPERDFCGGLGSDSITARKYLETLVQVTGKTLKEIRNLLGSEKSLALHEESKKPV